MSGRPVISAGWGMPSSASKVGARSARRPSCKVGAAAEQEGRDRVGGVGGVRSAGLGVAHQLAIAVVGGDQQRAARLGDGVGDAAQAGIDGFDRLDGGGEAAGVADHVGVCDSSCTIRSYLAAAIASTARSVSSGADISGCRS